MKRMRLLGVLLFIAILAACTPQEQYIISNVNADRYALTKSWEELPRVSDLIAVVTPKAQENVLIYHDDGQVAFGYTKTEGNVQQVLQGTLGEGETVYITEECYTTEKGSILHTQGGYLPMNMGESYLLFLKAYPADDPDYAGMYYPVDLEYGKYALSAADYSGQLTSHAGIAVYQVGINGDFQEYYKWYRYVYEHYPSAFA